MYTDYFDLKLQPFKIAPDPCFIYWNPAHSNAVNILRFGMIHLSPITVVTGEIGVGKTTLLLKFLEEADEDFSIALLSNFNSGSGHLFGWVLDAFGLSADGTPIEQFTKLQDHLIAEYGAGRRCVVIVDEAQNVSDADLEQLRMLTNINSGKDILILLYLIGQPQLRDRLLEPRNRQIAQRVGATYHLGPMAPEDTAKYVRHRLSVAGAVDEIFDDGALEMIHAASGGLPRVVNLICNMALVSAFGDEVTKITAADMATYLREAREHGYLSHILTGSTPNAPATAPVERPVEASSPEILPIFGRRTTNGRQQVRLMSELNAAVAKPEPETGAEDRPDAAAETGLRDAPTPQMEKQAPPQIGRVLKRFDQDHPASLALAGQEVSETPPEEVPPPEADTGGPLVLKRTDEAAGTSRSRLSVWIGLACVAAISMSAVWYHSTRTDRPAPAQPGEPVVTGLEGQAAALVAEPKAPLAPETVNLIEPADGEALMWEALDLGATDPSAAALNYARAALRGEAMAAYYLGQMYETGDGVPFNATLARAWYEAGSESVRGARRRLGELSVPERSVAISAPMPVLGGPLRGGGSEFVWTSGDDPGPANYTVEVAADITAAIRRLSALSTSAFMAGDLGDAKVWRVIAFDPEAAVYAVSDWHGLGASPEPAVLAGGQGLRPVVVVKASATTPDAVVARAIESLGDVAVEVVKAESPGQVRTSVFFAFEEDRAAARDVAGKLGGGAATEQVSATSGSSIAGLAPGRIIVRLAER